MMKRLVILLLLVLSVTTARSQHYAPFEVDTVQHIAKLNIQVKELSKKFLATFAAQQLNANFASDWQKVVEQIIAKKLPDLNENGDISVDAEEYIVEITAPDMAQLQKVIRSLKPYLASTGKMESFFTEPDRPERNKPEKRVREEKEDIDD